MIDYQGSDYSKVRNTNRDCPPDTFAHPDTSLVGRGNEESGMVAMIPMGTSRKKLELAMLAKDEVMM